MVTQVGDPLAQESTLSNWAGPYVTDMLGRGRALASEPYQGYGGALTAGPSTLQTNAFQGLGALSTPTGMGTAVTGGTYTGDVYTPASYASSLSPTQTANAYTPTSFTGPGYDAPTAQQAVDGQSNIPMSSSVLQQYMNPYLQGALQPQYDAANRQNEIAQQAMRSQYGKAGAFGGGRQAVASAELDRGMLDRMAGITGSGYRDAFTQAQQQFNTEQERQRADRAFGAGQFNTEQSRLMADRAFGAGQFNTEQSRLMADRDFEAGQFNTQAVRDMAAQKQNNDYGFSLLNAQQGAGAVQRGMQGEQVAADMAQFELERDDPYKKVQYMQSLLQGLPIETQSYEYAEPSGLSQFTSGAGGILGLMQSVGILPKT